MSLEGVQAAFQELVRRYERAVFNLIVRLVRDPALAEDVAQDAFVKAFRKLATFDPARRFSSWLLRIAHNAALDAVRRRRANPVISGDDVDPAAPAPPDPVERASLGKAIDGALGLLRPEWRAAIVLRYDEELSYEEIADVLGIPEGTVKTFVHRARKQLMDALTAAGWQP